MHNGNRLSIPNCARIAPVEGVLLGGGQNSYELSSWDINERLSLDFFCLLITVASELPFTQTTVMLKHKYFRRIIVSLL